MKLRFKGGMSDWVWNRVFLLNILVIFIAMVGFFISLPLIGIGMGLVVWISVTAAFWCGSWSTAYMSETTIRANETSVMFKKSHGKKVVSYDDIKDVKLIREIARTGGNSCRYSEKVSIDLRDGGSFWFSRPADDINLEKIVERPEELKERLDSSPFIELKTYIESKLPIC